MQYRMIIYPIFYACNTLNSDAVIPLERYFFAGCPSSLARSVAT
jgi:hypothetical protein